MKNLMLFWLIFFVVQSTVAQHYQPVDEGSKVHFVIKNFGINTGGDFTGLNGDILFDPQKMQQNSFNVSVLAATIDTDNKSRDKNLKEEYFDAENYPQIRIVSTKIDRTNKSDEGYFYYTGKLIIRDVTKTISFPFKAEKQGDNYLFTGEFQINRLDYHVGSSSTVLSNKVNISLKVLAKKK